MKANPHPCPLAKDQVINIWCETDWLHRLGVQGTDESLVAALVSRSMLKLSRLAARECLRPELN